jgi:phospholipid transport system substrate-binding protein
MKRQLSIFLALFFLGIFAFAASSPMPMLEKTANQLISQLQKNKSKLKNNPALINRLVNSYILPHVDQEQMARSVVNRAIWSNASSVQRSEFVSQFRQLVIRTYASAFSNYTNETVKFKPLRSGQLNQSYVKVNSIVARSGAPSIPVTYAVSKSGGKWMITDFSVDGVSMVSSFKSQFASLDTGKGLPGLTSILKKHNQK